MGGINTENSVGASLSTPSNMNKEVGIDPITGGKILRGEVFLKKTGRQCNDQEMQLKIDDAEMEVNGNIVYLAHGYPHPVDPYLKEVVNNMLIMADLLGTRDFSEDRSKAYKILYKLLGLVKTNVKARMDIWLAYGIKPVDAKAEEIATFSPKLNEGTILPGIFEAKTKLAICELAMKQLSDKETPDERLGRGKELYQKMIGFCREAREALQAYTVKIEDDAYHLEERNIYLLLAKSCVLEARFRALRSGQNDTDITIKGLLDKAAKYINKTKVIYNTFIRNTALGLTIKEK